MALANAPLRHRAPLLGPPRSASCAELRQYTQNYAYRRVLSIHQSSNLTTLSDPSSCAGTGVYCYREAPAAARIRATAPTALRGLTRAARRELRELAWCPQASRAVKRRVSRRPSHGFARPQVPPCVARLFQSSNLPISLLCDITAMPRDTSSRAIPGVSQSAVARRDLTRYGKTRRSLGEGGLIIAAWYSVSAGKSHPHAQSPLAAFFLHSSEFRVSTVLHCELVSRVIVRM